mgnify:CR=1 FL=1
MSARTATTATTHATHTHSHPLLVRQRAGDDGYNSWEEEEEGYDDGYDEGMAMEEEEGYDHMWAPPPHMLPPW